MTDNNQNTEKNSRRITRRSVLASISTGAMIGLAGCGGGGDGDDGGTSTPPGEVKSAMPTTSGSSSDSLIPGRIVHQGLEGVEVLDHWAERTPSAWIKVKLQNNRDEPLKRPGDFHNNPDADMIRSRVLTEQGNQLSSDVWVRNTQLGPAKIKPGTSAIIGLGAPGQETAARYELCLHKMTDTYKMPGWKKACTDWTPTPSPTPSPGPGPGSNDVIHNGLDNVEVTGYRMTEAEDGRPVVEVDLKNNGEFIKRFYVAVQFYDQWGRYYPEREPVWNWMHPARSGRNYDGFEAGMSQTVKVSMRAMRVPEDPIEIESYEICIDSTNNALTAEKIIPTCKWPRDG